jgi:lipocalin
MKLKLFLIILASLIITGCGDKSKTVSTINTAAVEKVDIERYMGRWYEIARFPNRFENDLVGVTADYSIDKKGKIKVLNSGYKNTLQGKLKKAHGKAKIPDPQKPGMLKVAFFLFFYGDYFILELDRDYQWVLVGSSTPEYLWILSRTPQIDPVIYNAIIKKAESKGYDITKLEMVKQHVK